MAALPALGTWIRFVITAGTAFWANWDTISGQFERHDDVLDEPIFGYYSNHVIEFRDSAGAFSTRERGMFGIHWINVTDDALDTTWIAADFSAVESAVQTMFTAMQGNIYNGCRLVEHRWYAYGPGVLPPNPPARVTTIGSPIAGTLSSGSVPQVGSTVTLRTALRRHWGRFYFPIGSANASSNGQLPNTIVTNLANAARTMLTAAEASQGIVPVVWDRQRKSVFGVQAVEADSVMDIQRRRRPHSPTYRVVLDAPA